MSTPTDPAPARSRRARAAATRLANAGGIGTVAHIARAWNLTEGAVRRHTRNPTFPAHAFTVGRQRIWTMAEADEWRQTQPTRTPRA